MHIIRPLLKSSIIMKRYHNTYTKRESEPLFNSIKYGFGFGIGLMPSLIVTYSICVTNTIYEIKTQYK